MNKRKNLSIIGGGPAAMMLAAQLNPELYHVSIYEQKKSVGRKFLVAGEGGLNLTYHEPITKLIQKYDPVDFMEAALRNFSNEDFITWLSELGIPTFVGSSNRVFPDKALKPITVLNKILDHLRAKKVAIKTSCKWTGWTSEGNLCFENLAPVNSDITVFAMGGASWKVTGSDGNWRNIFLNQNIEIVPFRAANAAFKVKWEKNFITAHRGKPLKNISLTFDQSTIKGELVITEFGLEGNAIYALSQKIQNALLTKKSVTIYLYLKPTLTSENLKIKYQNGSFSKITDRLKSAINLNRTAISLLKHCTSKSIFQDADSLCEHIKRLPIEIHTADDLDRAISSLGGVALNEVDENFGLKKVSDTYVIGEMLDWYAPTGGYLLQGCFSMGVALARHLNGARDLE